jgi:hypothetical protein
MAMDPHEQIVRLASTLIERTLSAESLPWQQADYYSTFLLATPNGSVSIGAVDRDDAPPFRLSLFDKEGQIIDSLISEWGPDNLPAWWNEVLANVWNAARSQAFNVRSVISEFLADLEQGVFLQASPPNDSDEEPF